MHFGSLSLKWQLSEEGDVISVSLLSKKAAVLPIIITLTCCDVSRTPSMTGIPDPGAVITPEMLYAYLK